MSAPTFSINPAHAHTASATRFALADAPLPQPRSSSQMPSRLPPLTRGRPHGDALTPAQRCSLIAGIVAIHLAGGYALMQVDAVREAVLQAAPIFVDLIAPPAPPVPPAPPPPPTPRPIVQKKPPPVRVIAAAPSPAPSEFIVPSPPPAPIEAPAEPVMVAVPTPPAPPVPPAPPPEPKTIPASAVEYLEVPQPVYPRLSMRNGEHGRVMVRVLIDTNGLPREVHVNVSSGYVRLDDAAVAAVGKARFKPYTVNGLPTAAWALVPIDWQ
jgi:protein TonB